MKKLILPAIMIAAITVACQHDRVDEVTPPAIINNLSTEELQIANSIGRLGSSSEALAQAAAYQKTNSATTASITVSRANIETILGQSHTVGIRAYYVINNDGKLDLALVGIDKNLNNRYLTNAMFSSGKTISEENIKQQIASFQLENPNAIRAVAFGSGVLLDVLSNSNCAGLHFHFITDKDGGRNLIFAGIDNQLNDIVNISSNGRSSADSGAGRDGRPCPQDCGN